MPWNSGATGGPWLSNVIVEESYTLLVFLRRSTRCKCVMKHYRRNINQSNNSHVGRTFGIGQEEFLINRFESLEEFVPKRCEHSPTRRSPVGVNLPPKACYQQDFMRVTSEELGLEGGVRVQREWTGATKGCVHFYTRDVRSAVELLREGDQVRITGHTDRFTCGVYRLWLDDESIRQWLLSAKHLCVFFFVLSGFLRRNLLT